MTIPDMTPIGSSQLSHIGHDGAFIGILYVRFRARGSDPGQLWAYQGVPRALFEGFNRSESPGKFFHAKIRGTYRGERIE